MRRLHTITLVAFCAILPAGRQAANGEPFTSPGVVRASAAVDSVFIDRLTPEVFIAGGDWGSYLMARLGVTPIPHDLRLRVSVNPERIVIHGRIADLPREAVATLGPLLGMFPPETPVAADLTLDRVALEVVRFRLAEVRVRNMSLPETLVATVMLGVGSQYPALGKTGRDLFVEIPTDGQVQLVTGGVRLSTTPAHGAGR